MKSTQLRALTRSGSASRSLAGPRAQQVSQETASLRGSAALPGQGLRTADTLQPALAGSGGGRRPAPREQTALLLLEARMRVSPKPIISDPRPRHT